MISNLHLDNVYVNSPSIVKYTVNEKNLDIFNVWKKEQKSSIPHPDFNLKILLLQSLLFSFFSLKKNPKSERHSKQTPLFVCRDNIGFKRYILSGNL